MTDKPYYILIEVPNAAAAREFKSYHLDMMGEWAGTMRGVWPKVPLPVRLDSLFGRNRLKRPQRANY